MFLLSDKLVGQCRDLFSCLPCHSFLSFCVVRQTVYLKSTHVDDVDFDAEATLANHVELVQSAAAAAAAAAAAPLGLPSY